MKAILRTLIVALGIGAIVQAATNARSMSESNPKEPKEKKENKIKTPTREAAKQPTI